MRKMSIVAALAACALAVPAYAEGAPIGATFQRAVLQHWEQPLPLRMRPRMHMPGNGNYRLVPLAQYEPTASGFVWRTEFAGGEFRYGPHSIRTSTLQRRSWRPDLPIESRQEGMVGITFRLSLDHRLWLVWT